MSSEVRTFFEFHFSITHSNITDITGVIVMAPTYNDAYHRMASMKLPCFEDGIVKLDLVKEVFDVVDIPEEPTEKVG